MKSPQEQPHPQTPRSFNLGPSEKVSFVMESDLPPKPARSSRRLWRALLALAGTAGILLIAAFIFFIFQGLSLSERVQFEKNQDTSFLSELKQLTHSFFKSPEKTLRSDENGRINILLLGRAGDAYPGKNLTDTVMIASIDQHSKRVALLSLPRDLYVPIADTALYTKLNSVYQYGLSIDSGTAPIEETISRVTGLPVHYVVILDFDGFEKIIDDLGGISLDVPRDLVDTRYPGKNYSYETFTIHKGWQTLDGATALKYVRERHADPEGDFGRAKRQQQVLQAVKNKTFSLGTLFNISTINRLLTTLGDNLKTNLSLEDMSQLLQLTRTLDTTNVSTVVVDAWKKESLLRVSHVQVGDIAAFILVPRVGNWSEITDLGKNIFSQDEQKKKLLAIRSEAPTLTLYCTPRDRQAALHMASLLKEELGFTQVTLLTLPPFHTQPKESIMVRRVDTDKPFSLDLLLKRFSPDDAPALPFTPSLSATESDFSLILGSELAEALILETAVPDSDTDDSSFSEPLPPQPKKK